MSDTPDSSSQHVRRLPLILACAVGLFAAYTSFRWLSAEWSLSAFKPGLLMLTIEWMIAGFLLSMALKRPSVEGQSDHVTKRSPLVLVCFICWLCSFLASFVLPSLIRPHGPDAGMAAGTLFLMMFLVSLAFSMLGLLKAMIDWRILMLPDRLLGILPCVITLVAGFIIEMCAV